MLKKEGWSAIGRKERASETFSFRYQDQHFHWNGPTDWCVFVIMNEEKGQRAVFPWQESLSHTRRLSAPLAVVSLGTDPCLLRDFSWCRWRVLWYICGSPAISWYHTFLSPTACVHKYNVLKVFFCFLVCFLSLSSIPVRPVATKPGITPSASPGHLLMSYIRVSQRCVCVLKPRWSIFPPILITCVLLPSSTHTLYFSLFGA